MEKGACVKIGNYIFICVGEIIPDKKNGAIYGYNPKDNYTKKLLPLNPYGNKTFCRFTISGLPKEAGAYAVFIDGNNKPVYIGRTVNLKKRWSYCNYGAISP